ncbi:zinc-dependent alcohol dehydrogenase [Cohnella soli]|uniref:Zinc-binding dehydrogenase n=1 Tax=Cohnella soli TaxID=425005 RepID=A0ABW0I4D6_9BACL
MRTSALLFQGRDDARLGEVEIDDVQPGEVQVRTISSFISTGTERWILTDRFSSSGTPYPCVPGYQRVGIVTQVGAEVSNIHVGERVIATSGSWTGETKSFWGAHLAVANTSSSEIYKIPDGVRNDDASGVVVAQVGYHAASRVAMSEGDWVVIYGDGIIGHCASQAARARGARTILVGRRKERLALGAEFSADYVLNARSDDIPQQVLKITGGQPVTAIIDTLQQPALQREYVSLLQVGKGQVVYCGHSLDKAWADMPLMQEKGLTCHYVSDWTRERIEATISLMNEGAIHLAPLVTHRGTADEAPGFYRMLLDNKEPFLGIIIDWSTEQ